MSLLDVLRSGVKIADSTTKALQAEVTFEHITGHDPYGEPIFGPPQKILALCDWRQKEVSTLGGQLTVSRIIVTFLNVDDVSRVTNGEGIDNGDRITLPAGETGPILDMSGFIDAGTGQPLATEVYLGEHQV